jgi:hypothetical protein
MSQLDDEIASAGNIDPSYVAARRILLDALTALAPHGKAIIVVGAQAIYLRTGLNDVAIAPFTTDGDLALDPTLLGDDPELEVSMRAAGFEPQIQRDRPNVTEPGIWVAKTKIDGQELTVPVDLIVPEAVAPGGGRRGARLGVHGNRAARRAIGLEAALVDHDTMTVQSLDPTDSREVDVEVAGTAALLVAKAHKINDRVSSERVDRLSDKDASDVFRVMQTESPVEMGAKLAALCNNSVAGEATKAALRYVLEMFGQRTAPGVEMAQRALSLAIPQDQVATVCVSFSERLIAAARR